MEMFSRLYAGIEARLAHLGPSQSEIEGESFFGDSPE
jgi:hypothetical protein